MWLDKILKYKREELEHLKRKVRQVDVRQQAEDTGPARDFRGALTRPPSAATLSHQGERETGNEVHIIAEIKKASPSAGMILPNYDPVGIAVQYEENGAAALSILTDEHFFQGALHHMGLVKQKVSLPILRKDFVFDEYQIYEARGAGADAVLLITRILDEVQLKDFRQVAVGLGMEALVEVHNAMEAEQAVRSGAPLIGINNRDLDTLQIDLAVSEQLAKKIPESILKISESGISERDDIERLKKVGFFAFLIGESLLKAEDPGEKLREILKT